MSALKFNGPADGWLTWRGSHCLGSHFDTSHNCEVKAPIHTTVRRNGRRPFRIKPTVNQNIPSVWWCVVCVLAYCAIGRSLRWLTLVRGPVNCPELPPDCQRARQVLSTNFWLVVVPVAPDKGLGK